MKNKSSEAFLYQYSTFKLFVLNLIFEGEKKYEYLIGSYFKIIDRWYKKEGTDLVLVSNEAYIKDLEEFIKKQEK